MCVIVGSPAIDEQADGSDAGAWDHKWHAELRSADTVVPGFQSAVYLLSIRSIQQFETRPVTYPVIDGSTYLCSQKESDTQRDIV